MPGRGYGQFCGFARALEVVGERWTLLIVRDLLIGPKRFTDLLRGLNGIPTNILTTRLRELENDGIVHRRVLPRPDGSVVYELTDYGRGLEETVDALGRWGARALDAPRPGEVVTLDSMLTAMRTTFHPAAARGVHCSYELRFGEIVLHVRVDDGTLVLGAGALPDADLSIAAGPGIKSLMTGEISAAEALEREVVAVRGDASLLETFAQLFCID